MKQSQASANKAVGTCRNGESCRPWKENGWLLKASPVSWSVG